MKPFRCGHARTPDNAYPRPDGTDRCATCWRAYQAKRGRSRTSKCGACSKPIGRNKSGLCIACIVAKAQAKRVCVACDRQISRKSTTAHCRTCSNKLLPHRPRKVPVYCACGKQLSYVNKTGQCLPCWRKPKPAPEPAQFVPVPACRHWCAQCERNVQTAEADRCRSPWCGVKAAA